MGNKENNMKKVSSDILQFHLNYKKCQANVAKKLEKQDPAFCKIYESEFDIVPPYSAQKPYLILDTDIASDIDDAMALLHLLHMPENSFELLGIATVFGWVEIRKSVTELFLKAVPKFQKVPVAAGFSTPMGAHDPIWHTGREGQYVIDTKEIIKLRELSSDKYIDKRQPIKWYVDILNNLPKGKKVTIIAIGPLTNLAKLYSEYPEIAKGRIERLVIMSAGLCKYSSPEFSCETGLNIPSTMNWKDMIPGEIYSHSICHNIRHDVKAAYTLISKSTEFNQIIQFITPEVTHDLWFTEPYMSKLLSSSKPPEALILAKMMTSWLEHRTEAFNQPIHGTCPHDSVACVEAIYPNLTCKYKRGWFFVHPNVGYTVFVPDPFEGPHYGASQIDGKKYLEFLSTSFARELTIKDMNNPKIGIT